MTEPVSLTALLESLGGATLEFPFGPETEVWKVGGKIFALRPLDSAGAPAARVSLKCDPVEAQMLRTDFAGVTPGYHLNKKHWITVDTDADVDTDLVLDLTARSYDLVLASLTRAARVRVLGNGDGI